MVQYLLLIAVISLLWHMSLSTNTCSRTITGGQITFLCPSNVTNQDLNLYDLTVNQLDSIISIVASGLNAASLGPFTSIPPNICLLRHLQQIDFSSNQIGDVDPTGSLNGCFTNLVTLNLQSNNISKFPSFMIYNIPSLKNLIFQKNQLTEIPVNSFADVSLLEIIDFSYNQLTSFELWPLEVQTIADFSHNQISTITNKDFFDNFNSTNTPTIRLTNNQPTINFTDAIYEMYNQCEEVYEWYFSNTGINTPLPSFTRKLSQIDFGTTQIKCSCDQVYFLTILADSFGTLNNLPVNLPIRTATCVNDSLDINNALFVNSSCSSPPQDINSTVDFSQVYPRLCKIFPDEDGELTPIVNISAPSSNASTYPHYKTAFLQPGACVFTFITITTTNIICTSDISNSLSIIPNNLLSNSYMSGITNVIFPSLISSLPSYLCSLPSHVINLSNQVFTTLTDATFPCLDSFTTITLSHNQLTSVSMSNGNFKNLNSLDLSSNFLTTLPYSILRPTPTSLRYLDLRNNSITYIDLFIYTLQNITINLDGNPINSSVVINPQNATIQSNTTSTVNITFPTNVINSTIIIQDTTVATVIACASFNSIQSFLQNLRLAASSVLLTCTCASYSLRQLYQQNGYSITDYFGCSSAIDAQTFPNLTNASCPNAVHFQTTNCTTSSSNSSVPSVVGASNSSNTGLIVGLVVGIVGFFILVGAIVAAVLILKAKQAAAAKKPISRAKVIGQKPGDSLSTRVQPRNLRSVKLTPIPASSSSPALPDVPVITFVPKANSFLLSYPNSNLPTSAKGIPVRLDSITSPTDINPQYPPSSNALNNSSSLRPINNNVSTYQVEIPQQQFQAPKPQKPRIDQMLNTGGEIRY